MQTLNGTKKYSMKDGVFSMNVKKRKNYSHKTDLYSKSKKKSLKLQITTV